jgi:hypothetical protein
VTKTNLNKDILPGNSVISSLLNDLRHLIQTQAGVCGKQPVSELRTDMPVRCLRGALHQPAHEVLEGAAASKAVGAMVKAAPQLLSDDRAVLVHEL